MNGFLLVNNLAGLLILTSLLVIGVSRVVSAAKLYALQSFVLVMIFVALGNIQGAHELYWWGISAFVTKVILVPLIMCKMVGPLTDSEGLKSWLSPAWLILAATLIVAVSWFAVSSVQLPGVAQLKPALAVSLGHFMLGLLCIVSQRNILKQIFGYCLMENGAHLTLALLASRAPELVEVGIATDAVFAVVVMGLLAKKIHRTMQTLDVQQLSALKG
jgi:hydrogenase-4 component E